MTITAKVILDSVSPAGVRLTTLAMRYPHFIHPQLLTHRVFSRNTSSSRAIPVQRLIEDVERDPVVPTSWGRNCKGMQAREELSADEQLAAQDWWMRARAHAISDAKEGAATHAHKQIVNRVLEPYSHVNVVVTATEWNNFFALRCDDHAQPEMHALADAMRDAIDRSTPSLVPAGGWHTPYVDKAADAERLLRFFGRDTTRNIEAMLLHLSVARCARVSYLTHDGRVPAIEEDFGLYERLFTDRHASPFEHQATPVLTPALSHPASNLHGWRQYRHMVFETKGSECPT